MYVCIFIDNYIYISIYPMDFHHHQDPNTGSSRIRPERKEGMLLKKSKGALLLMSRDPLPSMIFPPGLLHHWSEKWVVLENHELLGYGLKWCYQNS